MKTVKQIYLTKEDLEILSKASEILKALAKLGKGDAKDVMFTYRDLWTLSTPCTNDEITHWDRFEFSDSSARDLVDTWNDSVIIEES